MPRAREAGQGRGLAWLANGNADIRVRGHRSSWREFSPAKNGWEVILPRIKALRVGGRESVLEVRVRKDEDGLEYGRSEISRFVWPCGDKTPEAMSTSPN